MTGRLVDMSFSLNRKQRITLEVDSDFRSLWDKLNQEPLLDIEIKKHRNKRSHSANAYFHVLVNKIAAETGESDDLVKERLVVAYGTVARDKDGCTVGFKLPVSVDVHDLYKYTRCFDVREEDGKWFNCYLVYKDTSKMDTKEFSHLIDGAIDEAKALGIETDTPEQLARYRDKSKRLGLWANLCPWCHQNGPNAIHRNHDEDLRLKKWAQKKAMEHYGWPEEKFRQEFGRSYL